MHKKKAKKNFFKKPVLFIHGYAGNRFSFGLMIRRFEKKNWGLKAAVIKVSADGKIKVQGNPAIKGALVQVLFEDNRAALDEQVTWLKDILKKLAEDYALKDVVVVAHSMGAVSVLNYLTRYGDKKALPLVSKLVTLGAPYNDVEPGKTAKKIERSPLSAQGPLYPSAGYQRLKRWRMKISPQTKFLNIIGDTGVGQSDGAVSISSARSLRYLLDKRVYNEIIVTGKKATHRRLHENHVVDLKIKKFLSQK
ncbi:hypothetical protein FC81_GL000353 [Liquorilactobacillus capillatus DSM 19910]|uniref:Alpha/beta hydrolase n=1 Tax=Liquorilactobacillus capillatus DSM 19910 TaxID=1423731 RepID=A0A0R1M480_9LACO|nr:hypothetical protein FC81_GL000353 [Liquorilactobacillus capillatus DSM 19910]